MKRGTLRFSFYSRNTGVTIVHHDSNPWLQSAFITNVHLSAGFNDTGTSFWRVPGSPAIPCRAHDPGLSDEEFVSVLRRCRTANEVAQRSFLCWLYPVTSEGWYHPP